MTTRGRSSDAQDRFSAEALGKNEHKENELRKPNVSKQANGNPISLLKVAIRLTLSLVLEEEVA